MSQYTVRVSGGQTYGPVDEQTLRRWASEGRIPRDAVLLDERGGESAAIDHDALRPILGAPPTRPGPVHRGFPNDGGMSSLIPYQNPPALIGYYISVASLIPILALALGPTAVILGVIGLRNQRAEPRRKGKAHAIVAIALGSVTTLGNLALIMVPLVISSR